MSKASTTRIPALLLIAALLAAGAMLTGCSDDDPVSPVQISESEVDATLDAAESVATDVAEDNGGLMDQVSDLVGYATAADPGAKEFVPGEEIESIYDPATGQWTITIERERGEPDDLFYALFLRVYRLRYLNAEGVPQQFLVTDGDTARTMEFGILEGAGEHHTPRLDQSLTGLAGDLVATGLNTDLIVINGTYSRSAVNTLTTMPFIRTAEHSLEMSLLDVTAPADYHGDLSLAVSGVIAGTSVVDITTDGRRGTFSRHVESAFTMDLADGSGRFLLGGRSFRALLNVGDLIEE